MSGPQSILSDLWAQGFTVDLTEDRRLLVHPASSLHDRQREALRAHKREIVSYLEACQARSKRLQDELIHAAMRACDYWGDGPEQREEMRQDCINIPDELKPQLLQYFQATYRGAESEGIAPVTNQLLSTNAR
ncbi:putative nucleic acid-binding Zn-ribbon protein [Variovorax paradoxus]|uniref:hypothetical protein n=1 Tax=Variovorax atrisoli TaxID=3394203 RepID=UPI00119B215F|nr:hypothetical protein [Variovorax paradoxus]MDR6523081.1 putative nucleic acid-binding Zn-ribbon protein [Variovorax paradoxus]